MTRDPRVPGFMNGNAGEKGKHVEGEPPSSHESARDPESNTERTLHETKDSRIEEKSRGFDQR